MADQNAVEEQEMDIYMVNNEVRVPSPSIEEIMKAVVQSSVREQVLNAATEVETPASPVVFLDCIATIPEGTDDGFEQNTVEQSTIPDWLRERIRAKVPKEAHSEENTSTFLEKVSEPVIVKPPKPARKFSLIQRDNAGFKTVQIAMPKEGKTRDNIPRGL